MTKYNDHNIPIECWECEESPDWVKETACAYGLQAITAHIQTKHADLYPTLREAAAQAEKWMEGAYDREDEAEEAYHADFAYERKLNALRGKP
jgi:hypothetical protein